MTALSRQQAGSRRHCQLRELLRAVWHFFAWLEQHGIDELVGIEPLHVATYIETLQDKVAKPTVKQHLAAIRMFF